MIWLCVAIIKPTGKQELYPIQYMDMTLNGKPVHIMVDMGVEANIMTKTVATRLGFSYNLSNTHLKMVNAPPTPICSITHGMDITLGKCLGKTKFVVAPLDIFDIILG